MNERRTAGFQGWRGDGNELPRTGLALSGLALALALAAGSWAGEGVPPAAEAVRPSADEARPSAQTAGASNENVRPPAVAGRFYNGDPDALRRDVDRMLAEAPARKLQGRVKALVLPHAGYEFSGSVAAAGVKALSGTWKTVVLIGSSHNFPLRRAAVYAKGAFSTPLGTVPVDEDLAGRLLADPALFEAGPEAHAPEHSLEVQLPFLQRTLKGFGIVPILVNGDDLDMLRRVGGAVAAASRAATAARAGAAAGDAGGAADGTDVLVVISSDLSHYPETRAARKADLALMRALKRMDPGYFLAAARAIETHGEPGLATAACGASAVAAGIVAAKGLGARSAELIRYANSGETAPRLAGPDRSVGYAAVALVDSGRPDGPRVPVDGRQRKLMLAAARASLRDAFANKPLAAEPFSDAPELNLPSGLFVTLLKDGRLRGCIGTTAPHLGLLDASRYFARAAAFEDPRFPRLEPAELDKVKIEISILSEPTPVPDAAAVKPGVHGVTVSKGQNSGLFLPSVWEQLPGKEEFLSRLCSEKARLPPDCWKDPEVRLQTFTADKFEEDDLR